MATTKKKKKLPIDMYGRSMSKYADGGFSSANRAPDPVIIPSLPAGTIQDLEYQKYLAKINSEGIEKVAQSPGLLSTKTTNTTGDAIGAIGGIAGGFLSNAGIKQVEKGHMIGGTAMQAAGAVAPIATNPALLAATGGLSALAIPLAAGVGALAGIPKQNKYNRIEKGNDIEEQMAMYQGMDAQNNYIQDAIRYAAYGGKINHYGDGGETYDPTTDPNLMKEVVITAARKNVVADMFAGIIDNMNTPGASKNRKNNLELMKTLTDYLQSPTQTNDFLSKSIGKRTIPVFYGDSNVTQFPNTYMPKAAYGGQQGELAQLEKLNGVKENYIDKYGRTIDTNATSSHNTMSSKGQGNMPTDYLDISKDPHIFSAKSYSKNELNTILSAYKALTGNIPDLKAIAPYYNLDNKAKISPADINKAVSNKLNAKNLTDNSFNTGALNSRNQVLADAATKTFNEVLNPATYKTVAQQGQQQILHAAYGGKVNHYAYGIGDPEDEPGYRSGSSSWSGAPGAGLRDAQYPPEMLNPPTVNVPTTITGTPTVPPPTYTPLPSDGPYNSRMTPKAFTTYIEPRGLYDNAPIDIAPPDPWQNPPYAYPTTTTPEQEFEKHKQETGGGNYPGFSGYTPPESLNGTSTTGNRKSPFKLSPADWSALGVTGANAAASLLTLQQKMYDNEVTDKSGVYNMKTELPNNFTNPALGALRAGLQSSAQNNNWKNTSAMSSEMLSKTVAGLNSALLEQSRQNVGLFNAKQAAIYQALGVDTASKLAWNKDKTTLGNYKLSAIGENLLKMASNGNTRAAENALAQMDDATLRAMLATIGPNSKYFTEQIERIINSRKGIIQSDKKSV